MQRGEIERTSVGGEHVRAFVPLPPVPALVLDGPLQKRLEAAALALGRLDAIPMLLTDEALFLYTCVRKEAVLSSRPFLEATDESGACSLRSCSATQACCASRSCT